jgi:hypothetical protein
MPPIPPVLERIKFPNGGSLPGASRETGSVSDSSGSDSFRSVLLRVSQYGASSREKRPAAVGDAKALPPKGLDSIVSRRRVPGRVADEGELTPKVLEAPWDKDALRPFVAPW